MKLIIVLLIAYFPLIASAQSDTTVKKHKHAFTIPDSCQCKCLHLHGNFCKFPGCKAKEVWVGDWYQEADTVAVKNKKLIIYPGHPQYH